MAYVKRCILLIICVLLPLVTRSQGEGGAFFSLSPDADGWKLDFVTGRLAMADSADGVSLEVAGMANHAAAVGLPALPVASRLLLLPKGSEVVLSSCRLSGVDTLWLEGERQVMPYRGATVKDAAPPSAEADKSVYGADVWWRGGAPVEVENLGVMGRRQVVRVTVRPVACNPVQHGLCVAERVTATLAVTPPSKSTGPVEWMPRLVVVSRPQFREGLQPFVRWKRQEGYEVTEVYAGTHKRDSIKAMLPPECDYILLVGDVEQLQAWVGTTHPDGLGSHVTDLYYAECTGDYLPDALIGRWPVGDTAQLGAVVRKTLVYEQGTDLDTVRLKRMLLVAGTEAHPPAPTTTNGQVGYVAREARLAHPALDTVCFRNPASANQRSTILSAIGQGGAMLNYTAHCTAAGWTMPSVSFGSVDTLDNAQPMLWVNNCCLSNAFDGTCFGEQLLRKPVGGAIGVIGATNSTLWNEDYYWAVGPKYPLSSDPVYDSTRLGAFDRWTGRVGDVQTQGGLLAAGNLAVTAFGSPYDKFYWEIYCLLGDPTLRPWVGVPQPIGLQLADSMPRNGDAALCLEGTSGVTVTAMQHDTVLGVGRVGEDGRLMLTLSACLDTVPLVLTATAPGCLPCFDTLEVGPASGRAVAFREVAVTDSVVTCRVENVGTMPLYGLHIVLGQPDADSAEDALLQESEVVTDTLLPQQSVRVGVPVSLLTVGQRPCWEARLAACDSLGEVLCSLLLRHAMDVQYPEAAFRLLEAGGGEAHRLLPHHDYLFETVLDGTCDDFSIVLTALPTLDTLLILNSSSLVSTVTLTTPDTLTHLCVAARLALGNHCREYSCYLVAGTRSDGFDAGFAAYPWRQGGTQPWTVEDGSARSGAIDHHQTSDLLIDVLLHQADSVSFRAKSSSEAQYDMLLFLVDGERQGQALSGEVGWTQYAVALAPGRHTLQWRYVKDGSGSAGGDCVWLDDVRLPLALWDSAYGFPASSLGIGNCTRVTARYSVYPNPATDKVVIEGAATHAEVSLTDLYGREVYRCAVSLPTTLRLPALPDGLYLLRVGEEFNYKMIIRR